MEARYPSSLAPFGLEDPVCRLIFYELDSKWHSLELMIGNRFDDSGYYAMVKGRDIIFRLEWVHLCMKNLRRTFFLEKNEFLRKRFSFILRMIAVAIATFSGIFWLCWNSIILNSVEVRFFSI